MRNKSPSLDFIEFFGKSTVRLKDNILKLYQKGLSITDISEQLGLGRNSIWRCLKKHQKEMRPQGAVSVSEWKKGRGKASSRPPYGFCYFEGQIIKDPKEYPVLQFIQNLWTRGTSISSIMLKLQEKGYRSRTGKAWSYNVIKSTILRIENGSLSHLDQNGNNHKNTKCNETENENGI